jgi:hypothetical protein
MQAMLRAADNPFAVHRVLRQRYRLGERQWARLLERLESLQWRAAIVGPKGSGKTTLLEDLGERLRARGLRTHLLYLFADCRTLPRDLARLGASDVVLCDGADQLSALAWWRLRIRTSSAKGLVITTHRPRRLPMLHRCTTTPQLLRDITTSLGVDLSMQESVALHAIHAGNIREALRELYDRCWLLGTGS